MKKYLHVRIEEQELEKLQKIAERDHRSVSGLVALIVSEWLRRQPGGAKRPVKKAE